MIEVITELRIYSFDGRILEIFEINGDTKRYHIALIQRIEVEDRGRKGYRVNMDYGTHNYPVRLGVRDSYIPEMQKFIAVVADAIK